MVSDFWHTSMRMAIVGQRLLVFEHAQTTGTHCSEILLGLGSYYRKVRIFFYLLLSFFKIFSPHWPSQCDRCLGLVWGLMAGLQGTASHESGMFVWGLALEVEAPGWPRHPLSTSDTVVNHFKMFFLNTLTGIAPYFVIYSVSARRATFLVQEEPFFFWPMLFQ